MKLFRFLSISVSCLAAAAVMVLMYLTELLDLNYEGVKLLLSILAGEK